MRPTSTRALVLRAWRGALQVEDVPLPTTLEAGALLVSIDCATVCGSDVHIWEGAIADFPGIELPIVMGHEMTGVIIEMGGTGVRDALGNQLNLGDRVIWSEASCGQCYFCTVLGSPSMCPNRRLPIRQRADIDPFVLGGLSEYCVVPAGAECLTVPEDIPSAWASAATCAFKTVNKAFRTAGRLPLGGTVVVQGAGPLGLYGVAMAAAHGVGRIICVGGPPERLRLAEMLGATHLVEIPGGQLPDERVEAVRQLTGGRGAEVIFDLSGGPTVLPEAILMAAPQGRIVVVGTVSKSDAPMESQWIMRKELRIQGSAGGSVGDVWESLAFLKAHSHLDWNEFFSPPRSLDQTSEAIFAMSQLREIKPVIVPRG